MALLKSYTCSNCGGVLNFDGDQAIFECPFCGNEFTVTDFHREDYLNQAETHLSRLKFNLAREKYEALLNRNPKDFEALRGMVLVEGRISSLNVIRDIGKLGECNCTAARKAAEEAEKVSDDKEYFAKLITMLDLAYRYSIYQKEKDFNSNRAGKRFNDAAEKEAKEYRAIEEQKENTKARLFLIPLVLPLVCLYYMITDPSSIPFVAIGTVIGLIIVGITISISDKNTKPKPTNVTVYNHSMGDALDEKQNEIKKNYSGLYPELRKLDPAIKGYMPPQDSEKKNMNNTPFEDIEQTVVCAKCAGQLIADKERNLYECRFCGVAYGMSLFFNNPLEKAKNALRFAEFTEADQRFSHVLMVNPRDFEALLGRILCAGKWKKVEDIKATDNMISVMEQNLLERTAEACEHSDNEHKEFFETLQKLAEVLVQYVENEQAEKRTSYEIENAGKKADINITSKNGGDCEVTKQAAKMELIKAKRNELYREFGIHKTSLLHQMESIR